MANNFKSDDSFLRKLAIGAAGTNASMRRLKAMGFNPIELERGSTGFKIWKKIKIKRVRVPDILCLDTGLRVESRGKTKPEISMSHSLRDPRRSWDTGMKDDDFVSIVVFEQDEALPLDIRQISPIHFISVKDMRRAFDAKQVSTTTPKGVEEGSEVRVVWDCAVAKNKSTVIAVDTERIRMISVSPSPPQLVKLSRSSGKIHLLPQVETGEAVEANQIVASVVPISTVLERRPNVDEAYFIAKLGSSSPSERYAAAKALRYRGYSSASPILTSRMNDADEHIYVQLEAAAALAAHDNRSGWEFLESKLRSSVMAVPLEAQLETVIVVSEIPKTQSEQLLIEVMGDSQRDDELRAGAAWALGQFASVSSATALVETFNASPLEVKTEAARALLRISDSLIPVLIDLLKTGDPARRDGLSWVLARSGRFDPTDTLAGADENLRMWISYIVGYGRERFEQDKVEAICKQDPEVYFAASVLWQIMASWVNELREY